MSAPAGPTGTLRYCGRHFTPAELDTIRALTTSLPTRAQIAGRPARHWTGGASMAGPRR